jgi:hypothetical protein
VSVIHVTNLRNDGQDRQDGHDSSYDKTHENNRQARPHVHFVQRRPIFVIVVVIVPLEQKDAAQHKGNNQADHDTREIVRGTPPIDLAQPRVDLLPPLPRRRGKAAVKGYVVPLGPPIDLAAIVDFVQQLLV